MVALPRVSILRDAAILTVTGAAFALDASLRSSKGRLATTVGLAAGTLAAVSGFVLHEWGHLTGSLVGGSVVHYPNKVFAPLLFHFDTERNTREQFLWMSYGGYVASAVGMLGILAFVPGHTLAGRTARLLAGLGMVVTAIAEVPTTLRVLRGEALPKGYAFRVPST